VQLKDTRDIVRQRTAGVVHRMASAADDDVPYGADDNLDEGGGYNIGYYRDGRAVQVDTIKPSYKAPGAERLKPKCDGPLSNFALKFNLRRYTTGTRACRRPPTTPSPSACCAVGRCSLTPG